MIIDSKYISDEDMKQINKYTRKDFTRDDIYAFEVTLCDNKIDKDFERIPTNCLYKLKNMVLGSTGILTNNQTARIYDVDCRPTFEDNNTYLKAKAYVLRSRIQKEELENILNDSEVSIGFAIKNRTCSICGNNFDFCEHHKGQKYDNKLCYAILDEPTDFYEWVIVPKPNNEKSKTQEESEMKTKTQLKINGEMKDVEIENGEITIIEPEKKTTGWKKIKGKKFYYSNQYGITDYFDEGVQYDIDMHSKANYFSNRELAENINRMQTLQRQMFRWQAENDRPTNIKDTVAGNRYVIVYDIDTKRLKVNPSNFYTVGFVTCFSSREKAEECAGVFKDELTWLFTEFKWRMDGE